MIPTIEMYMLNDTESDAVYGWRYGGDARLCILQKMLAALTWRRHTKLSTVRTDWPRNDEA